MDPIVVECPNCGAALPPGDPKTGYACSYCGTQFRLQGARSAKTMAGIALTPQQLEQIAHALGRAEDPARNAALREAAERHQRRAVRIALTTTVLVAVGTMATAYFVSQVQVPPQLDALSGVADAIRNTTEKVVEPSFVWDDTTGPPEIVRDDDRTLVVGRTRSIPGDDELSVDAYDLATGRRAYRIGDLGTYSNAMQFVHFAVVGPDLVVTTPGGTLRVHDARDGSLRSETPLTDRVKDLCRDEEGNLFVAQLDERYFVRRPGSTRLEPLERPPRSCTWLRESARRRARTGKLLGSLGPPRRSSKKGPAIPKTRTLARFDAGKDGTVVIGVRHPGTAVPKAARFEGDEPVWTADIADVPLASIRDSDLLATMHDGRLFAVFGVGTDGWRMTALDAKTGARLWSIDLEPLFAVDWIDFLVAADDMVLVDRGSGLEVRRATDGTKAYVLGSLTYE
ncbi:MAG: hypothetical protein D6705_11670 [Deltaproteobacteria bacterium]|nr:MAG: hypothetical protein D6705_11670 [Deltaproteobacteria bacterium]